jgi:hypothetical protein
VLFDVGEKMKLWIGAEMSADVADAWRVARNATEASINELLQKREYELPVTQWNCIGIVRDDANFAERATYSKKKRSMDFRLSIDHDRFKTASSAIRERMVFEMLLRSLEILCAKSGEAAGIELLTKDIKELAVTKGWISKQ